VDGPPSEHRHSDGGLCLWFPIDPRPRRWTIDDGLLQLLLLSIAHLFKEAWWRESDEWLGEHVHHGGEAA
jgi:hypothetical protein